MNIFAKKLVHIVAASDIEKRLVKVAEKYNNGAYSVIEARGGGTKGVQSGLMEMDSNVLFMMIVPEEGLEAVLGSLERMIGRGYQMIVWVTDVQVLRRDKFGSSPG